VGISGTLKSISALRRLVWLVNNSLKRLAWFVNYFLKKVVWLVNYPLKSLVWFVNYSLKMTWVTTFSKCVIKSILSYSCCLLAYVLECLSVKEVLLLRV